MKNKLIGWLKRPELVFVSIVLPFGLLSTFMMPILGAPDENQHFQVEYAIFSSNKQPSSDITLSEGVILAAVKDDRYRSFYTHKTDASHDGLSINTNASVFGGTKASVTDLMRLPQAVGIVIGRLIYPSVAVMVIAGRLVNLALYVTVLYYIIKKVRFGKWAFVFVASLPMMIQQVGSLSYDSNNLLIMFAWFAFVINLWLQKKPITKKQLVLGVSLIILLLFSKLNNLLLLGLLAALPEQYFTQFRWVRKAQTSRYWRAIKAGGIVSCTVVLLLGAYGMGSALLNGNAFQPERLGLVLINTYFSGDTALIDVSVKGMVGVFSNFYYGLPMWSVVIAFAVLVIIMMSENNPGITRRMASISGLLFFASILLITVGMYYNWAIRPERLGPNAMVADGIQGRYFTPLLVLLAPTISYLRKFLKVTASNALSTPILASSTSVFLLTLYLFQTWHFFWR